MSAAESQVRKTGREAWAALIAAVADGRWIGLARLKPAILVVCILFGVAFTADLQSFGAHGLMGPKGDFLGRDFVIEWAPPRMAWSGHAGQVYGVREFATQIPGVVGREPEAKPYAYPPFDLILAAPFSWPPYLLAFGLWTAAGLALLAAMLAPRLGGPWALMTLWAAPAVFFNAYSGQNGAFTAAMLVGGLMLLPRRPVLAGALLGLLTCKPQLALLVPIALMAGGRWRALAGAAGAALALTAVSLALWGPAPWLAWVHNITAGEGGAHVFGFALNGSANASAGHSIAWLHWRRMASVYATARLLGASSGLAMLLQAVVSTAAVALTALVWRGAAAPRLKAAFLVVATLAATPYAWDYDMIGVVFAAFWMRDEAMVGGWRRWERPALLALLAAPAVSPFVVLACGLDLEPFAVWWVLILLFRRAVGRDTSDAGDSIPAAAGVQA